MCVFVRCEKSIVSMLSSSKLNDSHKHVKTVYKPVALDSIVAFGVCWFWKIYQAGKTKWFLAFMKLRNGVFTIIIFHVTNSTNS